MRGVVMLAKPPSGRWVVEQLVHVLYEVLRETNPDTARSTLVGATLGVVTALKLLVRLETCGTIVLTAVPESIDAIEQFSNELAEELFDRLAGEAVGVGTLHCRLDAGRFSRTANTLSFRLAAPLDLDEVAPAELNDASTLSGVADRVVARMMALFERTMRTLDGKPVILGKVSFIVGFTALAKVLMAYWGHGQLASGIEALADLDSDARYREIFSARHIN